MFINNCISQNYYLLFIYQTRDLQRNLGSQRQYEKLLRQEAGAILTYQQVTKNDESLNGDKAEVQEEKTKSQLVPHHLQPARTLKGRECHTQHCPHQTLKIHGSELRVPDSSPSP